MSRLFVEVVGDKETVKDVIQICHAHFGKCVVSRMSTCEYIIKVEVDNFIQKWRIKKDIRNFKYYLDEADVNVVGAIGA